MNQGDSKQAEKACAKIDRSKPNCWIGLQAPFKKWDDGKKLHEFVNWSPGEPNNRGGKENCAELYSKGDGKWNDLACKAKRFFLCNMETDIQRMDFHERESLVERRLERHQKKWEMYQKVNKQKKYFKNLMRKFRERAKEMAKMQKEKMEKQR
eukprot:205444_1